MGGAQKTVKKMHTIVWFVQGKEFFCLKSLLN